MKKKVLFLSSEKGFGGIENEVIVLANSLVNLYDVELLFLDDFNNLEDINSKIKVTIHKKQFVGDAKFYKELILGKDVVISTNGIFNKYVLKYGQGKKIFWSYEEITDSKGLEEMKHFDTIVVPNKKLYEKYNEINNNVVVINNAICINEHISDLSSNNIVFVGKLREEKRIDDLLAVISLVNREMDVNLYIVGEGNIRADLEKKGLDRNLKNVHFLGLLSKENLEKLFLNSSLFVTCSEKETLALSVLEAMSYGLPIVAFNGDLTLKLLVLDEINGYLIDNRDKDVMKDKIIALMSDPQLRQTFGNCAREKVLEYDINSIKREWIKII